MTHVQRLTHPEAAEEVGAPLAADQLGRPVRYVTASTRPRVPGPGYLSAVELIHALRRRA